MSYCEDCGCRIYNHGCVNCNEESYIYFDQMCDIGMPVSDEFKATVDEQVEKERARIALGREGK